MNEHITSECELEEAEHLVARIQREREESQRGFSDFLEAVGVANLRGHVAKMAGAPA